MKKLFGVLLLLIGMGLNAQVIEFEDANFEQELLRNARITLDDGTTDIDVNNNGKIEVEEALKVISIRLSSSNIDGSFSELRYFQNLVSFTLWNMHRVETVNLIQNIKLESIVIRGCDDLVDLDLSKNIKLKTLEIDKCPLVSTVNLSELSELITLRLSNNKLELLELSENSELKKIAVNDSILSTIDLSKQLKLTAIDIANAPITTLELSNNTLLDTLNLNNNQLTKLNLSSNKALLSLKINDNNIEELDVSECINLSYLEFFYRENKAIPLKLDLSKLVNLKTLWCSTKELIDISNNINLEYIYFYDSPIESIDLLIYPNLNKFGLGKALLNSFDATKYPNLEWLFFIDVPLDDLNLSKNTELELLIIDKTNIEYLDCSNNLELNTIYCSSNNNLESINLKGTSVEVDHTLHLDHPDLGQINPNLKSICVNDDIKEELEKELEEFGYNDVFVSSFCSFTPGGKYYTIKGSNENCDDPTVSIPFLKYEIKNELEEGTIISNENGNYNYHLQEGTYTITPEQNPELYTITPESIEVSFPTQLDTLVNNFCFIPNKKSKDLEITMIPIGIRARPGFDSWYKLSYTNKSFATESGIIKLKYLDDILDFVQSTPDFTLNNTSELIWEYTDLKPFETREITIKFNTNSPQETPAVNAGDVLVFKAAITPVVDDLTPEDNSFELRQTVVGSYDPNDKTCLEGNEVLPEMIGEYVHYKIRFENKGTFAAENIVVVDEIDETKFDLSTLTPLDASHDFETRIKENKVEFIFEGIQLPYDAKDTSDTVNTDDNNDGYIVFKIKTLPTLKLGDSFSNQASIYFDFNFPIITNNETTTIVEEHLGVADFEFNQELTVYPNPVQDRLYITSNSDAKVLSLEIYNIQGQLILSVPQVTKMSFDVSRLSKGTYLVSVKTDKGVAVSKMVKE